MMISVDELCSLHDRLNNALFGGKLKRSYPRPTEEGTIPNDVLEMEISHAGKGIEFYANAA